MTVTGTEVGTGHPPVSERPPVPPPARLDALSDIEPPRDGGSRAVVWRAPLRFGPPLVRGLPSLRQTNHGLYSP